MTFRFGNYDQCHVNWPKVWDPDNFVFCCMACAPDSREVAVIRDREATLALELQECQAGNVRRAVIGMVAIEMIEMVASETRGYYYKCTFPISP